MSNKKGVMKHIMNLNSVEYFTLYRKETHKIILLC